MSIDPLKINPGMHLPRVKPVAVPKTGGTGLTFEQQLQRAVQADGRAESAVAQAETLLKMAQLHLWQGLFVPDEETPQDQLFNPSGWLPQLDQVVTKAERGEQLYRQLQPSLCEKNLSPQGEIERLIDQVAESVSLAPELIRSVVAAESDFQPQAVSPVGAQGLMQLMPATAAELGVEDSFDPEQNLLGGSRYLKQLLDKYDGDLDKTLAAYNWGQGNVDRKGLAQMPQETRDYLAKIKGMLNAQG